MFSRNTHNWYSKSVELSQSLNQRLEVKFMDPRRIFCQFAIGSPVSKMIPCSLAVRDLCYQGSTMITGYDEI